MCGVAELVVHRDGHAKLGAIQDIIMLTPRGPLVVDQALELDPYLLELEGFIWACVGVMCYVCGMLCGGVTNKTK